MRFNVIRSNESMQKTSQRNTNNHRLEKFTKRKSKIEINGKYNINCDPIISKIMRKQQRQLHETCATKSVIKMSQTNNLSTKLTLTFIALLFCLAYCCCCFSRCLVQAEPEPNPLPTVNQATQQQLSNTQPALVEYQLTGAVGEQSHLPCLIGRQLYCGEPYFIAWYKLNTSSRSWARIEHKSEEELLASEASSSSLSSNVPTTFNERVRFTWWRTQMLSQQSAIAASSNNNNYQQQRLAASNARFACEQLSVNGVRSSPVSQQSHRFRSTKIDSNFDCATLTINSLELPDEGQYKCEITFSESLDFDKCPATTLSRLTVIAKPNEPELLVNGQHVAASNNGSAYSSNNNNNNSNNNNRMLTFKEGAQVKLDCQSSGGKPAPRIEWLNISSPVALQSIFNALDNNRASNGIDSIPIQFTEIQLMRSYWPQKKTTFSLADQLTTPIGSHISQNHQQPITSSSVTISLSRFDLHSHFVCLVLPATAISNDLTSSQTLNNHLSQEQLIKNPAYLSTLFANQMRASGSSDIHQQNLASTPAVAPMLKWIKLDVQVKPSSVSINVRDVEADTNLKPLLEWPQHSSPIVSLEPSQQPFYSLEANKLYAIQCLVENSRPKSHVAWFNRTAPIEVATQTLDQASPREYLVPSKNHSSKHRLSSFIHSTAHANGTFRTVSTLLLTASVYDNFEELFCRVSNEAFQFDELIQVAPIISARLYVNFAPFAWLEADFTSSSAKWVKAAQEEKDRESELERSSLVSIEQGDQLVLRCSVAANPLAQNTILQIEWLKDGRKLTTPPPSPQMTTNAIRQEQPLQQRIQIERANHLHMPATVQIGQLEFVSGLSTMAAATGSFGSTSLSGPSLGGSQSNRQKSANGNQLAASSKLIASSLLTINAISRQDSGLYSCHFKLIPAPSNYAPPPKEASQIHHQHQQQQQQQIKITSGKAKQTIQVNVIEAKPKAPTLRILSSKGLLIYGLEEQFSKLLLSPSSLQTDSYNPTGSKALFSSIQQTRPLTVVVSQNALLSLKCDLPMIKTKHTQTNSANNNNNNNNNNNKQAETFGHKIMWYLNGAYLHSSSSSLDDVYNLTVDSLIALIGPSKPFTATLSCAHHFLSASSSPDNFHGSLMKIYQSANELDLKIKVQPRLVERRDLMPTIRSFSELELNANSASKLRLICMAECEPICSIDWYLNRQLFSPTTTTTKTKTSDKNSLLEVAPLLDSNPSATGSSSSNTRTHNNNQTVLSRRSLLELPLETGSSMMLFVENLIYNRYNSSSSSSKFTWLRETSFSGGNSKKRTVDAESSEFDSDIRQLMREADLHLTNTNVNVFSKFELTYNQIGQLLQSSQQTSGDEILLECKPNVMLQGRSYSSSFHPIGNGNGNGKGKQQQQLGYAFIEPQHWFPDGESSTSKSSSLYQFAMSNDQQLNLTTLFTAFITTQDDKSTTTDETNESSASGRQTSDANNESNNKRWNDLQAGRVFLPDLLPSNPSLTTTTTTTTTSTSSSFVNEMQIRILLDRAPQGASISFAGIVSNSDREPTGLSLSESQLLELTDLNKPAPMIHCNLHGAAYPEAKFRWTFTDLNRTEHLITSESAPQLNLRQFVEFRQRQLNLNPMSTYGVELVSNIVGNYTCSVANTHGSKSATLMLQVQGRPLCKLTLANEYLSSNNELMVNLRCLIYSTPVLLETIWFKNNQQLSVNKTSLEVLSSDNWLKSPLSALEIPVMILNKQQDFMLTDIVTTQLSNFKCIARNPLGYSEACELSQLDKQMLLKVYKPFGLGLSKSSPPLSMEPIPNAKNNFLANATIIGDFGLGIHGSSASFPSSNLNQESTSISSPESNSLMRGLFARIDWLVISACSLALIWLIFVAGISLVRRKFGGSDPRKLRPAKGNTSWRFNPATGASSSNEIVGLPFQSKVCVNYYGGSNGDSEHDMIQSCSQSSHYEDFAQHQQRLMINQQQQQQHLQQQHQHQHQLQQQQPVYFNSNHHNTSTLTRRPLKSSMSSSSTGDSSTSSKHLTRLNDRIIQSGTLRDFPSIRQSQPNKLATTTQPRGESLVANSGKHLSDTSGFTLTSNVTPLVDGKQTSRIQLDHSHQAPTRSQQYRFQPRESSHYSMRNNEHIYDDVIYNQMIL